MVYQEDHFIYKTPLTDAVIDHLIDIVEILASDSRIDLNTTDNDLHFPLIHTELI